MITIQDRIDILERQYLESFKLRDEQSQIFEYDFDSGEGEQRVKRRSLKEIDDHIASLGAQLDYLYRTLDGSHISVLRLNRRY